MQEYEDMASLIWIISFRHNPPSCAHAPATFHLRIHGQETTLLFLSSPRLESASIFAPSSFSQTMATSNSEEDEDEETLQLKLQAIEARLKLKKLQASKAKSARALALLSPDADISPDSNGDRIQWEERLKKIEQDRASSKSGRKL